MASGKSAEQIYKLINDCGGMPDNGSSVVLQDLIKYLDADTLIDFVDYFRRNHDMHQEEDDDIEYEENNFHLCIDCQETYNIDYHHECEETKPPQGVSKYFSSLVPEC